VLLYTSAANHRENVLSVAGYYEFIEAKLHAISDELVVDFILLPHKIQFITAVAGAAACDSVWKANGCHTIATYQKLFHQLRNHNKEVVHDAKKTISKLSDDVSII
jgi:hypothetical protein